MVIAACVLHNICLITDDNIEDFVDFDDEQEVNNYTNLEAPGETATNKRSRIKEYLATV